MKKEHLPRPEEVPEDTEPLKFPSVIKFPKFDRLTVTKEVKQDVKRRIEDRTSELDLNKNKRNLSDRAD